MKSKEEKLSIKMDQLGMDLDRYSIDELRRRNTAAVNQLAATLAGSRLYSVGSALSGRPSEVFQTEMARAQVEQNFIMIRQNEEIIRMLKLLFHQGQTR